MDIKRKIKQAANIMGIEKLRKSQVKPINDILEGRDTMVVACFFAETGRNEHLFFLTVAVIFDPFLKLYPGKVQLPQNGLEEGCVDTSCCSVIIQGS